MIIRKRLTTVVVFFGIWCLIAVPSLFAQKKDVIYRKDTGKSMTVDRVVSETYTEVKYKKGGKESKLNADRVARIQYFDAPDAWKNGLSLLSKGQFENAINSFTLAMESSKVRPWIKTYGLYQIGKAYQQWSLSSPVKIKDAVKTFNKLLKDDPQTRFYMDVMYNLGKSYSISGDLPNCIKTLDKLAQDAYDKKLGVIWEARAKFEKAVAQMNGGAFNEADRDLRSARTFATEQLKSAGEDQELALELKKIKGLSQLYQGSVLIKKKKYSDATRFFKSIINDKTSDEVAKAGAAVGLGECLLAEKKLKEAQAQFAEAKVLYSYLEEEGARATYYLGLVCLELKEKEPGYKKRAKEYFSEVIKGYPNTEWAKMAQAKIN